MVWFSDWIKTALIHYSALYELQWCFSSCRQIFIVPVTELILIPIQGAHTHETTQSLAVMTEQDIKGPVGSGRVKRNCEILLLLIEMDSKNLLKQQPVHLCLVGWGGERETF